MAQIITTNSWGWSWGGWTSYTAWDWIDITSGVISVESTVINWASAWATAVQPWDDISDLNNDAGYITNSAVKDGTLTIQKNWTTVQTFTANQSSNATANISVPTDTSDLTNNAWFITNSALSWYQTTLNMVTSLTWADNDHYPTAKAVADAITSSGGWDMLASVYDPNNVAANAFDYDNFINTPTIPWVIDSLTSTSTTDALSANQWKELKDLIDTYVGLWRFLSLWNSATWQPISFPLTTPYSYNTWDWYMVEVVDTTTNYMPNWSSYTWTASTTVDSTNNVEVRDVYIYDGTDWLFQKNNEVQVSFSDIAWNATDNTSLANALNAKADDSAVVKLTGNQTIAWTKTFSTSPVVPSKTSSATSSGTAIATEAQVKTVADAIPTKVSQLTNDSSYATTSQLPTVNNATLTIQKNWTTVNTFTANASSNVTANISVPTDTSDLTNGAWFVTNQVSDTAYWAWWDWDTTTAPSKNAVYDKISAMDTTISWKQDSLATQTAYTTKWTSTKVPTITTNTLWQVTAITETSISFPVTSVNGQTWAVTWLASMSTITVTINANTWSNKEVTVLAWWVTSSNTVIVSPAPSSINDYASNSVYCESQGSWTLTFKCNTVPDSAISVNVVILS